MLHKSQKSVVAVLVTSLSVSGCGMFNYQEQDSRAVELGQIINQHKADNGKVDRKVQWIERPPVDARPVVSDKAPAWASTVVGGISAQELPLSFVLGNLTQHLGITVDYGPDVNANATVTLLYTGTVKGALEALADQTGLEFTPRGQSLLVERYVTRTFDLNMLLGEPSFLFGKKSSADGEDDADMAEKTVTNSLGNNDLFSTSEAKNINSFSEIESAIKSILRKESKEMARDARFVQQGPTAVYDGDVIVTPTTHSMLVRTSPRRMRLVEEYIQSRNEVMGRQVQIEVKVIQFTDGTASQFGIDWELVKTDTNGKISFSGGGVNGFNGGNASNWGFSFVSTDPSWDGSTILIQSLQAQGRVAVQTEPRVVAMNGRVANIDVSDKVGYIARTEVTPNENSESSVEIEDGVVSDGLTMQVLPNITEDRVQLQVTGIISKLLGFKQTEVSGVTIETPKVSEIKFDQTARLRWGETLVLNGYKQETVENASNSEFEMPLLGGNAGQSKTLETIVLITPKRL